MKMARIKLPKPPQCSECGAQFDWELSHAVYPYTPKYVVVKELHSCQCSKSEYQLAFRKCLASGGHAWHTVSAGQHSYDVCRKCGHHG